VIPAHLREVPREVVRLGGDRVERPVDVEVALLDGDAVRQGAAVLGRGDLGGVLRGGVQQERHDLA
jgi:hypothetical protein